MGNKIPPDYLMGLLYSIETTTLSIYDEFPRLVDKDVEWVMDKLINYYKVRARGKEIDEPLSPSEMRQALVDEILNAIDTREEIKADIDNINNPNIRNGEHMFKSLEQFYIFGLKRILNSVRFWRKEGGRTGYLKFISEHMK